MNTTNQDLSTAFPEILKVTVHSRPGHPGNAVFPQTITLTNLVHTVLWHCGDLTPGARLQIHFLSQPAEGPFWALEAHEQVPDEVTGYGNRGPRATLKEYDYEVRVIRKDGSVKKVGAGHLINNANKVVPDPRSNGGDPPPDPPARQT